MTEPLASTEPAPPDAAAVAAAFGVALHAAGLPVGPDRCERLARAMMIMNASALPELRACARATMVSDPSQMPTFDRVFTAIFGGLNLPGMQSSLTRPTFPQASADRVPASSPASPAPAGGWNAGTQAAEAGLPSSEEDEDLPEAPARRRAASAAERLRSRDFTELSPAELSQLVALMRELTVAIPPRRTRRYRGPRRGKRPDLRRSMRQARRYGGEVVRLSHQARVLRPRRLVVLCDISGSMEPYARALLLLMYVLYGASPRGAPALRRGPQIRPELFSFATRLTRLTPALAAASPDTMLRKAGEAAPDWSGGTRIGAALKEFNDRYGAPGLARGAVVLIISDGWETGDPQLLGQQMARLARLAHRIVWANPRTQSPRYRPMVGGMAAAWPFCDAVVSAHNLDALDDLLTALS